MNSIKEESVQLITIISMDLNDHTVFDVLLDLDKRFGGWQWFEMMIRDKTRSALFQETQGPTAADVTIPISSDLVSLSHSVKFRGFNGC